MRDDAGDVLDRLPLRWSWQCSRRRLSGTSSVRRCENEPMTDDSRPDVALARDIERYLERLGVERETPSAAALARIHRAQVEHVPYETTWIHMGETVGVVDRWALLHRIASQQRGGYCFMLNGALSLLLEALGYDVTLHVGGVHGAEGPTREAMENHLVLVAHGLPTPENPGGDWYVDAGLGDGLHEPLPLVPGTYTQGPLTFQLGAIDSAIGDWQVLHDPLGSFTGMVFRAEPTTMESFAARHQYLSSSPESGFVKTVTVQRRDCAGVDVLRGQVLGRVGEPATADRTLETREEWFETVAGRFGLPLTDVPAEALDRLWERVHAAHEQWLAKQAAVTGE